MSRSKGSRGELEIVRLAKEQGFPARRTAPMQAAQGGAQHFADVDLGVPSVYLEVKRRETLAVPAWCAETELSAQLGQVPVVAWRKSSQPWRVSLPLADFLRLLKANPEVAASLRPLDDRIMDEADEH